MDSTEKPISAYLMQHIAFICVTKLAMTLKMYESKHDIVIDTKDPRGLGIGTLAGLHAKFLSVQDYRLTEMEAGFAVQGINEVLRMYNDVNGFAEPKYQSLDAKPHFAERMLPAGAYDQYCEDARQAA